MASMLAGRLHHASGVIRSGRSTCTIMLAMCGACDQIVMCSGGVASGAASLLQTLDSSWNIRHLISCHHLKCHNPETQQNEQCTKHCRWMPMSEAGNHRLVIL